METGADQNLDPLARDAGALERLEDRRQHHAVRHRPSLVRDHDDGVAPASRDVGQRRRADRVRERGAHRLDWIRERCGTRALDHLDVRAGGDLDLESRSSVVDSSMHDFEAIVLLANLR